jgi:hypothetical protein
VQPPGYYDTGCCWIAQHYFNLKARHNSCSEEEIKDKFRVCLNIDNPNVTVPERLLYIRLVWKIIFQNLCQSY